MSLLVGLRNSMEHR